MPSRTKAAAILAALALAACARSAPPLPPDLSALPAVDRLTAEDRQSPDAALACEHLASELAQNLQRAGSLESTLHGERDGNQAAGYFTALLLPPLMLAATQYDLKEKAELDQLQDRRDRLRRIKASKGCPAS